MQHHFSQSILLNQDDMLKYMEAHSSREKKIRLSIYRNNVFSSLTEALGEIYPVCKMLVGSQCFDALAYQYIQKNPPSSPVLSQYGEGFANFISQFSELATVPYLNELARLEYQLLQFTHAAEDKTMSPEDIQQKIMSFNDPTQTQWELTTNILLWKTTYAVGEIYHAHNSETDKSLATIHWQEPEYLLLTKNNLYGHFYQVSAEEWHMLSQFLLGRSFSQACAHLDEESLSGMFANIIQKPIIKAIHYLQGDLPC
ncbi:hypothetical protein VA7868_01715 [Vibrio aerogenes CECT 7868]|uniref:Putative DNA-binding domain-containing protein n=1 Tax=Vibrio aerogenes CECT 7868 TaxID=1216006 RepID=A0A1M5YGJ7_9VIBR|nr:DNA-binding domain-containing protein [Vibrio aerogenes]SHI11167.1 hypothetical protein VA7868_01715 [Vibrio aerogenes CECT 7868]